MSATTTRAPCFTKSRAVHSPMPLAPPVISATLPSSLRARKHVRDKLATRNK
jgi:hypothetical protein